MTRVLYVEASSGGVLGGSLTGLYHLIRGIDRERFQPAMVLYESKPIEADFGQLGVPVYHIRRRRLPKEHALRHYNGYHRVRRLGAVRDGLHAGRHAAQLVLEELPAAVALARVIARTRADVVHLGNGLRANFDGILACVLTRTPMICHVKGFEKYGSRERWASRRTRTVVCMTNAILQYCTAHGVRSADARVVYDAVDEEWLQPRRAVSAVRAELGVPQAAPCIGIAGNIQEWKGQRVLIEAMSEVGKAYPAAHCLIVGGIHRAGVEYAQALRQRTDELGLGDRVHFLGFRDDVVDVMNAVDIVVHASVRPEPFGRVILEGMLLTKPVIATGAGGVLELIEDGKTGFLVPPDDTQALARRLCEVLAAPEAARHVGIRAREWARAHFSLARHVAEMSRIYDAAVMQ